MKMFLQNVARTVPSVLVNLFIINFMTLILFSPDGAWSDAEDWSYQQEQVWHLFIQTEAWDVFHLFCPWWICNSDLR